MKRVLVIGAGLSGAVIARSLADSGYPVLVCDERPHLAGNCFTKRDKSTDILLHVYGPHIFHTDHEHVWRYVNGFTTFRPFENRVKTTVGGKVFSLPINLHTINQFFGKCLKPNEARAFISRLADSSISDPQTFEEQALRFVGRDLYDAFLKGYTIKQWGCHPRELPASILKRLPVRFSYDDNYYTHRYQGIPEAGYTALVEEILRHPDIEVQLSRRIRREGVDMFSHVFNSGPIDAWFDFEIGRLGYRTLEFRRYDYEGDFQGCAVMNYGDLDVPFTRVTEHKHFAPWEVHEKTVVYEEYSRSCEPEDIPYYPIRLMGEKKMLGAYVERARAETGVTFVGRLGTYRYLDMDVTIKEALEAASQFVEMSRSNREMPAFVKDPLSA